MKCFYSRLSELCTGKQVYSGQPIYVIIYEPMGSIVLWCIIQQNKTTSVAETVSFDLETHLFISDVKFFIVVDL